MKEIIVGILFGIGMCLIINSPPDETSPRQQRRVDAVKQAIVELCLERAVTDMSITLCTGDVDPADPMEDENAYTYNNADRID